MRQVEPTIAVPALWALADAAAARGLDPDALIARAGIDARHLDRAGAPPAAERRVLIRAMHDLWAALMRELRDPAFPVDVARRMTADHFDLFGFLLKTSETYGEAFRRAERYGAIWSDAMDFAIVEAPERMFVGYRHPVSTTTLGARCAIECVMAEIVGIVRSIGEPDIPGLEVRFAHAAPPDTGALAAWIRAPIHFDTDETGLAFERGWFAAQLPTRDRAMSDYFERQAAQLVAGRGAPRTYSGDVTKRIIDALPSGDASLARIARALGTTPRTLRRRLAEDGTTFEALVAEVREDLARRYLRRPDLSLAEIALVLGFADQSAFQRFFRRRTGQTPRGFRRAP